MAFCTLCFDELDVTLETNDNDDGNGDGDESPPSGSVAQATDGEKTPSPAEV